jgi:hypothetical protein
VNGKNYSRRELIMVLKAAVATLTANKVDFRTKNYN